MQAPEDNERPLLAPRFFGFVANARRTARAITGESTTSIRFLILCIGKSIERLLERLFVSINQHLFGMQPGKVRCIPALECRR